jgi:hypothetical protein
LGRIRAVTAKYSFTIVNVVTTTKSDVGGLMFDRCSTTTTDIAIKVGHKESSTTTTKVEWNHS